jgi:hypothetical protein
VAERGHEPEIILHGFALAGIESGEQLRGRAVRLEFDVFPWALARIWFARYVLVRNRLMFVWRSCSRAPDPLNNRRQADFAWGETIVSSLFNVKQLELAVGSSRTLERTVRKRECLRSNPKDYEVRLENRFSFVNKA